MAFDNNGLYAKIIDNNKKWSAEKLGEDTGFFKKLENGQAPPLLWMGCTANPLPANAAIAEKNMLSVLDYAVNILKVKHIIVGGQYNGGNTAIADSGICHSKDVYTLQPNAQDVLSGDEGCLKTLVELNVTAQVVDLAKTNIIQNAWKNEQEVCLHGWVYGLDNGTVTDLEVTLGSNADLNRAETA
jgi:carbonic anhydrase